MDQPAPFRYLTSEEFFQLTGQERAEYLARVQEHLAALEEAQRRDRDPKGKR